MQAAAVTTVAAAAVSEKTYGTTENRTHTESGVRTMRLVIDRGHLKILAVLLAAVLLGAIFFAGLFHWEAQYGTVANNGAQSLENSGLYLNGAYYAPKKNLETVLLIGVDKFEDQTKTQSYNNNQQADFLALLVIDRENKRHTVLHLNRDTMTQLPVLGVRGENAGSITGQLALAHTYGSGGTDSCRNTVKAVSGLLYGVNIDHYIAFTMDAVGQINDLAGGVTLTMLDDLTSVFPEMQQGERVTLTGDMALAYVRTRYGLEDSSNLRRMERQRQYLTALAAAISEKTSADDTFMIKALEAISTYMTSDCTANQLSQLYERWESYADDGIRTVEGSTVEGEEFMEFYPDETALKQLVAELFYTSVEE